MEESKQNIQNIIYGIDEEFVVFNYNYKKFKKTIEHDYYDLYTFSEAFDIEMKTLYDLLKSHKFEVFMNIYNKDYNINQYIYIKHFSETDKHIKIGRTFNIEQRYSINDINKTLIKVVKVKQVDKCEKELKSKFKKKFGTYNTLESFNTIDTIRSLKLFNKIVRNYMVPENDQFKYIVRNKYDTDKRVVNEDVFKVLFSLYSNKSMLEVNEIVDIFNNSAKNIDKNNYYSLFEQKIDNISHQFFYWKFHGYCIIVDANTNEFNMSRLWNTILDSDNITNKRFDRFLESVFISSILKNHPEYTPRKRTIKERPLLNGYYGDIIFVHFILQYLNSKYAIEVANLMIKRFLQKSSKKVDGGYSIIKINTSNENMFMDNLLTNLDGKLKEYEIMNNS